MREIRTSGSEGGEGHTLPDPYHEFACPKLRVSLRFVGLPGR